MNHLRERSEGEPIRAEDFNELVRAIRGLQTLTLGPGLSGGFSARGGLRLILRGWRDAFGGRAAMGVITKAPTDMAPVLPSDCFYDVEALDGEWKMEDAVPVYGRDVAGDQAAIFPARVGDLCIILRRPTDDDDVEDQLWILSERTVRAPCAEDEPEGSSL